MTFKLMGQLPSGKNRIIVTRTGKRFPDPKSRFPGWRDDVMKQIAEQMSWIPNLGIGYWPVTEKCGLVVDYTPGDRIVRDVPGLLDALCHVLERSGVVKNDGLIRDCQWHEFPMDREHPMAMVTVKRL
jgi:hypothetical protein